jgi:hypothetical protein
MARKPSAVMKARVKSKAKKPATRRKKPIEKREVAE